MSEFVEVINDRGYYHHTYQCEHQWTDGHIVPGWGVVTFDCVKCGHHIAINCDPDDEHRRSDVGYAGVKVCDNCELPREEDNDNGCEDTCGCYDYVEEEE